MKLNEFLKEIADVIREKTNTKELIPAVEFKKYIKKIGIDLKVIKNCKNTIYIEPIRQSIYIEKGDEL